MGGWLVVAGLLGIAVMLWLDARPSSWWYSRRAFERPVVPSGHSEVFHRYGKLRCPRCENPAWTEVSPSRVVLPPVPTDQHDRVPVELTRLPEEAVQNMRELEERKRSR
jgi:hypothetical protein